MPQEQPSTRSKIPTCAKKIIKPTPPSSMFFDMLCCVLFITHGRPSYTQLWLRQGEESVTQPDPQLLEPPGQQRPGSIQRKKGRGGDERRCVVQGWAVLVILCLESQKGMTSGLDWVKRINKSSDRVRLFICSHLIHGLEYLENWECRNMWWLAYRCTDSKYRTSGVRGTIPFTVALCAKSIHDLPALPGGVSSKYFSFLPQSKTAMSILSIVCGWVSLCVIMSCDGLACHLPCILCPPG